MSSLKSKHIWILVILVMAFIIPVRGQDVPGSNIEGISGTGHLIHIRDWLFDPTYHLSCPRDSPHDYHWYRQDKKGQWSHKPGYTGKVKNVDASGSIIMNPVKANHHYQTIFYNQGGIILWVRRK